jgi:hypothetical protein
MYIILNLFLLYIKGLFIFEVKIRMVAYRNYKNLLSFSCYLVISDYLGITWCQKWDLYYSTSDTM